MKHAIARPKLSLAVATSLVLTMLTAAAHAQGANTPSAGMTAEQDHQNMMDQLGIHALRSGPSGDEIDPNHANYNEAEANPFPNYPDPLTLKDGRKVTSPQMWWKLRRPEIVEAFEREVVRRIPGNTPKVT